MTLSGGTYSEAPFSAASEATAAAASPAAAAPLLAKPVLLRLSAGRRILRSPPPPAQPVATPGPPETAHPLLAKPILLRQFFAHRVLRSPPPPAQPVPPWDTFTQTFRDGFRAADTTVGVERYELFVGANGPPNFDANPTAVSQTLPFSWVPTPPATGLKVLHVVVRQRNKYGLASFNLMERVLTINSAGVEDLGPLTAPSGVAVYDGATGYLNVLATYTGEDDANPADTWEIYVGTDGVEPSPGVSAAAYTATMSFGFGRAGLNKLALGPYTAGATVRVIVTAKRASDSRRASAAVVMFTLAASLDLADADLFGGGSFT